MQRPVAVTSCNLCVGSKALLPRVAKETRPRTSARVAHFKLDSFDKGSQLLVLCRNLGCYNPNALRPWYPRRLCSMP